MFVYTLRMKEGITNENSNLVRFAKKGGTSRIVDQIFRARV